MADPILLGLCGALRAASTNHILMQAAARAFGPCTFSKGDLRLPLYDGDLEAEGIPQPVTLLAQQIAQADAVVVVTPEYNKALSGVLKNALDWVSRVPGGVWRDKPVAIMSAAAGRAGGERAQSSLRLCLTPFRPRILSGPEVMIANSAQAFAADGQIMDARTQALLQELMGDLRAACRPA